jgi:PAS domain-containing protein
MEIVKKEPYGYVRADGEGLFIYGEHQFQNITGAELVPVYLHPKEWVGLTDEERKQLWDEWENGHVVEATEAKLKEKNATN